MLEKKELGSAVFSTRNKMERVLWNFVYVTFFRLSPTFLFAFRVMILRLFGAEIGRGCAVYPNVRIWLPRNLKVGNQTAIANNVTLYNQGMINIGNRVIVSQGAHICASTHDYNTEVHPLLLRPIFIADDVWVCADAFVGPGVKLDNGTVVGARSVVFKDTQPWTVYAGNPALKIKERVKFNE